MQGFGGAGFGGTGFGFTNDGGNSGNADSNVVSHNAIPSPQPPPVPAAPLKTTPIAAQQPSPLPTTPGPAAAEGGTLTNSVMGGGGSNFVSSNTSPGPQDFESTITSITAGTQVPASDSSNYITSTTNSRIGIINTMSPSAQLPSHSFTSFPSHSTAPSSSPTPIHGSSKTSHMTMAIVASISIILPLLLAALLVIILRCRSPRSGEHRNRWWSSHLDTEENANNDTVLILSRENRGTTPPPMTPATSRRSSIVTSFDHGLTPRLLFGQMAEIRQEAGSIMRRDGIDSPTLPESETLHSANDGRSESLSTSDDTLTPSSMF